MVLICRDAMETLRLFGGGDLHDVVEQRSVHLLEPVRDTIGDDNYVAFSDTVDLAAADFLPANLIWRDGLRLHSSSAGHERRGAFQDVDGVCVARVNLGNTRNLPAAGVDLKLAFLQQRHSRGK